MSFPTPDDIVVYRDEFWLKVQNGMDMQTAFAAILTEALQRQRKELESELRAIHHNRERMTGDYLPGYPRFITGYDAPHDSSGGWIGD